MRQNDKPLMWLVCSLLFVASILFGLGARAQSFPSILNPDPEYWRKLYLTEKARADNLARYGTTAIAGLQASLKAANDSIVRQNEAIVIVATDRNSETDRANKAESKVAKLEKDRPKTKLGKIWKDVTGTLQVAIPAVIVGFGAGIAVSVFR
ncbi:hypothetical protein GCM10028805_22360 [Spirosoma harenae]